MRWSHWQTTILILATNSIFITSSLDISSQFTKKFKISPKPCRVDEVDGVCMFVWECIRSSGTHLGMCMDGFMFGSCCGHANNVIRPSTTFGNVAKPTTPYKSKPTKTSSNYGTFQTILRPNGNGMLVIRQPSNDHISLKTKTTSRQPSTISHTWNNFHDTSDAELTGAASVVANSWTSHPWTVTTEPNFVTKTKSPWDKTTPIRLKPKPTKRPIAYGSLPGNGTKKPTTSKPRPPTKPVISQITSQQTTTSQPVKSTASTRLPNMESSTASSFEISENTIPTEILSPIRPLPGRVTVSAARSMECGLSKTVTRPETRIVGGKNAPFGRYPWQVSVRRTSFFGFSSTHRCGGAVLNENFIATAGHCVDDLLTSQIRIRVGEYDFSHAQEQLPYIERSVLKKIVHPKYNFYTYEYDLALVKMDQRLEFAPHISPICLPATDDLLVGENGTVTGWGRLSEGGTLPSILQEVSVPIVSNAHCKSMFLKAGRHEFIPEIFLCAGHEAGQSDSCQGDSGGPLQVKGKDGHYFLAGIISWGIGCAEANLPGVCTRISKFQPWILENVSS